ncbi:MAG: cytochrome c biogenesis protein CcdA [Chloroflexota bacterium]
MLRDHQDLLRQIGGVVLIVLGLNLMGVIRIPILSRTWRPLESGPSLGRSERRGVVGGLVLGVVFALGWTLIGPTLGAILTMAAVSAGPQVMALLVAYCAGLGDAVPAARDRRRARRHRRRCRGMAGPWSSRAARSWW